VAPEVVKALENADIFRLLVPKRYGGHGATLRTAVDAVAEVARGDGSTGWIAALMTVGTGCASTSSAQAQGDVFGANAKAKVCGVFSPGSKPERVLADGVHEDGWDGEAVGEGERVPGQADVAWPGAGQSPAHDLQTQTFAHGLPPRRQELLSEVRTAGGEGTQRLGCRAEQHHQALACVLVELLPRRRGRSAPVGNAAACAADTIRHNCPQPCASRARNVALKEASVTCVPPRTGVRRRGAGPAGA
jgi:hypothetical protein